MESQPEIDNHYIAEICNQIAEMLEFKDENPFKIRSYKMAAETIDAMGDSIVEVAERGGATELQQIPGIGKTISSLVLEIIETGESAYFRELTIDVPASVLELRRVSGIGLKTAQTLYRDFGIKSLADLKQFAGGGGLLRVPGLGPKSVDRIKRSIERLEAIQN